LDVLPGSPGPDPGPGPGPSPTPGDPWDTFDTNTLDPALWTVTANGSRVAAASQELQITHSAGSWTSGSAQWATPYDLTGKATTLQLKRPANDARGGSSYGETSIVLWLDATHYAEFFAAGGSLTAWLRNGSGEVNLTPAWPAYRSADMQWLRFRVSGGTLYWEYAGGTSAPGAWTVLASKPIPFAITAVRYRIVAGSNLSVTDVARFDNVTTAGSGTAARTASIRRVSVRKPAKAVRHQPRVRRCAVARSHLVRRRNALPPRGSRGRRRLLAACVYAR